jgi:putative endonuclease
MFYVYIMASGRNGTLYIGQADNLNRRVFEHQSRAVPGFTARHNTKILVWFEAHDSRESALTTERRMKKWNRDWKIALIEMDNPNWDDLALRLEP